MRVTAAAAAGGLSSAQRTRATLVGGGLTSLPHGKLRHFQVPQNAASDKPRGRGLTVFPTRKAAVAPAVEPSESAMKPTGRPNMYPPPTCSVETRGRGNTARRRKEKRRGCFIFWPFDAADRPNEKVPPYPTSSTVLPTQLVVMRGGGGGGGSGKGGAQRGGMSARGDCQEKSC